jgi:hypothetical protein
MNLQRVLSLITGQSTTNSIARLIISILKLEEKLCDPGGQSEYFRWGIQSHFKRLSALRKEYESVRSEYNQSTIDQLISALKTEEQYLQKRIKPTFLVFVKIVIKNASDARIAKLNDYIKMKSITKELPELKNDTDLLLELMR